MQTSIPVKRNFAADNQLIALLADLEEIAAAIKVGELGLVGQMRPERVGSVIANERLAGVQGQLGLNLKLSCPD